MKIDYSIDIKFMPLVNKSMVFRLPYRDIILLFIITMMRYLNYLKSNIANV